MSHHHQHLTMSPVTINGQQQQQNSSITVPPFDHHHDYYHTIDQQLLDNVAYDALVWASLHGLLMGDKSYQVILLPSFLFISLLLSSYLNLI
jgi:hypothetical protein